MKVANILGLILLVALIAAVIAGCASPATKPVNDGDFNTSAITYFQDQRTEMCFGALMENRTAVSSSGSFTSSDAVTFTNVQCTSKVLNLVRK